MPGLFEQFPHTNFHELNLDWMIDLLNTFKDELENRAVLSVNGMTGEVTLYESENVVLPPLTNVSSWRLVRMMDGQYVGVLFQDGHVWLQQGNSTLKLLTTEDIPTSAGVVSINGMGGIVRLTGADIPIDNSADPDSVRLALETERTNRTNADNQLQNNIDSLSDNTTPLYKETKGAATSVQPNTWNTLAQITLSAGVWLIIGEVDYSTNTNGIRILMITYNETDQQNNLENSILATGRSVLTRDRILRTNTPITVYLRAYQTSGENLICTGDLKCLRLNTSWTT